MTTTEANRELAPKPVIQNGRYVLCGQRWTRVTRFAQTIEDRFGLEKWFKRMVAKGLTERRDLLAQVAANANDKKKLDAICEDAIEAAKGSEGANLGSALHSFTEQVDRGETPHIPEPWDADIAAYTATLAAAGVHVNPTLMERTVINTIAGVAGTFDRIVTIDGWDLPLIADLKTGDITYGMGTIAIQLAAYAYADKIYDPVTDKTAPMPAVDKRWALVIHLPAGKADCTLHLVNIEAGWEAVQICLAVRDWRRRHNLSEAFTLKAGESRAAFLARKVRSLAEHPVALQALAAQWPPGVPTFKASMDQTPDELEQIALVLTAVKARYGVPFDDTDTNHPTDNSTERVPA